MEFLKNVEEISKITMEPAAVSKCKIGGDWYRHKFRIEFEPGDVYPDYIEVNEYVMKMIDGKDLNIEEAVDILYKHLTCYQPKSLKVVDEIRGCKTHFDVIVEKSGMQKPTKKN